MSEKELRQISLVGVGANNRSLKFLNTKNNIATQNLSKQLTLFEREKTLSISAIDHERIDTQEFLKHVQKREHETKAAKSLLGRDSRSSTPPPPPRDARRRRKIRLAKTAPASMKKSEAKVEDKITNNRNDRKLMKSGPETQQEKERCLRLGPRKSIFLQLAGNSIHDDDSSSEEDEKPKKRHSLPRPNPKTLLDVMIGLNAFSHVPPPRCPSISSDTMEDIRTESRASTLGRDSIYDSNENIAHNFISQWRKRVASRKQSIFQKLESASNSHYDHNARCTSTALSSVPEDSLDTSFSRSKSKRSLRPSILPPTLPAIEDEDERQETFLAWIMEEKDKEKREEKAMVFKANNPKIDKAAKRRNSFAAWLKERSGIKKDMFDDDDDDDDNAVKFEPISEEDEGPQDIGDIMRTLLKIKTKFKDPLDARIRRFCEEIETLKVRDEAAKQPLSEKDRKRRWKMLMKGIDAALADSSDEEDNFYSTA